MRRERGGAFFSSEPVLGVAICTLAFLTIATVPVVGSLILFVTPLAILYFTLRLGRLQGWVIFALSLFGATISLWTIGRESYGIILFLVGWVGMVIAEAIQRRLSIEKTCFYAILSLLAPSAILLALYALRSDMNPLRMIETYVTTGIKLNLAHYAELGLMTEEMGLTPDHIERMGHLFTRIFPAFFFISGLFMVWLNLLLVRLLFRLRRMTVPDFGDLSRWKAPEKLIWLLLLAGVMLFLPYPEWFYVGLNLLMACLILYFFQGLSICSHFFQKKQLPMIVRGLFYTLVFLQQYVLLAVIGVGLFDLWIDFRKYIRDVPSEE